MIGNPPLRGRFEHPSYVIRRKILKLFGGAFHIYDPRGNVVFYSKQKAFKLKEDIRLYDNERDQNEVLSIRARQVLDFGATYDVFDPKTGGKVGALRRKGLRSLLRDEWAILDPTDHEIGFIQEDSKILALIRRFLFKFIPQRYVGYVGGAPVCRFRQNFNPFVMKIGLDFTEDRYRGLDRRLGIAAGILLCAIEGKQN